MFYLYVSITILPSEQCACTYYISVRAFSNCTFTLLAAYESRVRLQEGVPQNSEVEIGASRSFFQNVTADPSGHKQFVVTTQAYSGIYLLTSV